MSDLLDALVIGGGPGGATTALLLARAGWSVAVVERKTFPRRKVCGEYLSATNLPLLRALGLGELFETEAGPPVRRVALFAGEAVVTADLPRPAQLAGNGHGWGRALSREHLDTLLLREATSAGATVFQPATARTIVADRDRHLCLIQDMNTRQERLLEARLIVAAHGSWDQGALPTQVTRQRPRSGDLFGFKAHFTDGGLPTDLMPLLSFPGGYGGMVQADRGQVSLSCCVRRDVLGRIRQPHASGGPAGAAVLEHIRRHCRGVREALAGARLAGEWLAAGPIQPGIRLRGGLGLFTVGNAAGEAHPAVAEGISMAMQGAWLLCERLRPWMKDGADYGALDRVGGEYATAWRRSFGPRLRAASLIAQWAMRPRLVAVTMPFIRCWPALLSWGARLSGKDTVVMAQPAY
jgi:flavin-dependent dehydrogenase